MSAAPRIISAVIGLGLVAGVTVFAVRGLRTEAPDYRFRTHAYFRDGSRLPIGSKIVIAGVAVGEIEALTVEGGLARVDMRLDDEVVLWADAWAAKRNASILGDSYIELLPGGPELEAAPDAGPARLVSGQVIPRVIEGPATESDLRRINSAMPKIDYAMERVGEFVVSARQSLRGNTRKRADDVVAWLAAGNIERPLARIDRAAQDIDDFTTDAAVTTGRLARELNGQLDDFAADVAGATADMANARGELSRQLGNVRRGLDDIDPTVDRIAATLEDVNRDSPDGAWAGRGTLTRLIHDNELADTLDDGTQAVADGAAGLDRLKTWIGFRTEFNILSGRPRFYVIAEIAGRNDSFYLVELEKGGLGDVPEVAIADAPGTSDFTRTALIRERVRFTAQVGRRFGDWRIRGGLKDSTPGVGVDYMPMQGRLRVSGDLYDATFARSPRLKLGAALEVFRSIYVLAGVDDALSPGGELPIAPWPAGQDVPVWFDAVRYGRDYYAGAMLRFSDEDLANLLRVYGAVLVGLL